MDELIEKILQNYGVDPNKIVSNGQTAHEYLEGVIMGAMDVIEEE